VFGAEFWLGLLSNLIATFVGVVLAFEVERRREQSRERQANKARLESLRGVVFVLDASIEANVTAVETCERELGTGRFIVEPGLELFTWDAIKPQVVELLGNPAFIARIARFFSRVKAFELTVAAHRLHQTDELRTALINIGPQLRHEGRAIREALPRFNAKP
jgi:hypothetical protein